MRRINLLYFVLFSILLSFDCENWKEVRLLYMTRILASSFVVIYLSR